MKMYAVNSKKNIELLDIEAIIKAFNNYIILDNKIEEVNKEIKRIELNHTNIEYLENILEALEYANEKSVDKKYLVTIEQFIKEHYELEKIVELRKKIEQYEKEKVGELDKYICEKSSQFIEININGDRKLLDLTRPNASSIKMDGYSIEFANFILKMIMHQNCFVGKIDIEDLPLIMTIKHDLEEKSDKKGLASKIRIEMEKAHMTDAKLKTKEGSKIENKLPFILDCNEIQAKWDELDNEAPNLSREEYLLKYYKLLLLFGNNVEKVYNEAPDAEKEYVLDAYCYYSFQENEHHFRTASPLINTEVLKRKIK